MDWPVVQTLALSLGLGLLVGLQREWAAPHVAGIRTFALVSLFGTVLGMLAESYGPWLVIAGLLATTALMLTGTVIRLRTSEEVPGSTTPAAALLMYLVGVALAMGRTDLGVIIAGVVAILLHWKQMLHGFVERIGPKEIRAIFQLVLIGLVILPVLPDRSFGPYAVLNPYEIWLMVVLIVGISLGGYIAYRFLGARAGTLLSGVLGGLISSTATTVSYSRRSRHVPESAGMAAFAIMLASTIVFGRVAFEICLVAPEILAGVLPPLAVMTGVMAVIAGVLYATRQTEAETIPLDEDPTQLKSAIVFGLLYAAVLVAVAAAKEHLGDRGLYVVATVSGLTDVDAITLSTAQLIKRGQLTVDTGWRMILIGTLSNLVFKCAAVAVLGHRRLLTRVGLGFGVALLHRRPVAGVLAVGQTSSAVGWDSVPTGSAHQIGLSRPLGTESPSHRETAAMTSRVGRLAQDPGPPGRRSSVAGKFFERHVDGGH